MTPIEKNVLVVDENGNSFSSTYIRRAKGLVKHGRARWLDEHTICLTCPPDEMNLEDNDMKNHDEQIKDFDTIEAQMVESRPVEARLIGEAPQQAQEETDAHDKVTMDEILRRMDRVIEQGEHMMETIDRIAQIRPQPGSGGWGVGLGNMIEARESTNHKIMGLLIKMYDDIRPQDRRKNEAYPEIPETQPPLRMEKSIADAITESVAKTVTESLKSSMK